MIIGSSLYFFLSKLVYRETKENIYLHLEGNQQVYDNFFQVTYTRGILKLDFIANLEFFTCFATILVSDRVFDIQSIYVWLTLLGLLLLLMISNLIGGCSTILSPRKRMYRLYFLLRFLVEAAKITALFLLWLNSSIFWEKIEYNTPHTRQYQEFKISMTINVIITSITYGWSVWLIYTAQGLRRQNQAQHLKAMWRVEEKHFNPQIMALDQSQGVEA